MLKTLYRAPTGGVAVLAGIAFLTLNERRDLAQMRLREKAKTKTMQLDEVDVKNVDASINGRLLLYRGTLLSNKEVLDHDTGVGGALKQQQIVRLRRTVEMYRWVEKENTTIDSKGNRTTTYSYEKQWCKSASPIEHSTEHRNPDFPTGMPGGTHIFEGALYLGKEDFLNLDDQLVAQVEDWTPLPINTEKTDLPYSLRPSRSRAVLNNGKGYFDEIGDLRVTYDAVLSGPYTAVSKVKVISGDKNYLVPFKGKLSQSLASQADIRVPEGLEEVLPPNLKLDTFVIPEPVIRQMEHLLLMIAPLQIHMICRGHKSLDGAYQTIEMRDYKKLNEMRYLGGGIIFFGVLGALGPAVASTGVGIAGAAVTAVLISLKTIETSKPKYV